ncbi:hypothetical protein SAMN05421679_10234 [Epilithonimonas pallida]|uniref:Uncharacterized protein n=1 Tax=Epilithonimonas pallida TaxID=373671 RepID=A0ABY1R2J3_9FLAO|nr:hypothetical protein SAMN05421679_10234 [Epilithonimonas pallida]
MNYFYKINKKTNWKIYFLKLSDVRNFTSVYQKTVKKNIFIMKHFLNLQLSFLQ